MAECGSLILFSQRTEDLKHTIKLIAAIRRLDDSVTCFHQESLQKATSVTWKSQFMRKARAAKVAVCIISPAYIQSRACCEEFEAIREDQRVMVSPSMEVFNLTMNAPITDYSGGVQMKAHAQCIFLDEEGYKTTAMAILALYRKRKSRVDLTPNKRKDAQKAVPIGKNKILGIVPRHADPKSFECVKIIKGSDRFGFRHVTISPDKSMIISSEEGKGVRSTEQVWSQKGDLMHELRGFKDKKSSECIAFSSDGNYIVSGHYATQSLTLWRSSDGKFIREFRAQNEGHSAEHVNDVAIAPDDSFIVSSSHTHTLRLWDFNGRILCQQKQFDFEIYAIAISSDNSFMVGGEWAAIRIWRTKQYSSQTLFNYLQVNRFCHSRKLDAHTDHDTCKIDSIAISSNNAFIVSGAMKGSLWLWKSDGTLVNKINKGHGIYRGKYWCYKYLYCVAISPDNRFIISGGADNLLKFWDWNGDLICEKPGHAHFVCDVAIASDNSYIVSAGNDCTLRIWKASHFYD